MGASRHIPPLAIKRHDEGRKLGRIRLQTVDSNCGEVTDVSATGARLIWPGFRGPAVGGIVSLRIEGVDGPIDIEVRIVWSRRSGLFRHEVGVEFQDPDAAAKRGLVALVRRAPMNEVYARVDSLRRSA